MVNASELLINAVTMTEPTTAIGFSQNGRWPSCLLLEWGHVDHCAIGGQAGPNLPVSLSWNRVSPSSRPLGREVARRPVGAAGKGDRKKRMPSGNRVDRGLNVTPRESGQTSDWSLVARTPKNPESGLQGKNTPEWLKHSGASLCLEVRVLDGLHKRPIRDRLRACPFNRMEDSKLSAMHEAGPASSHQIADWNAIEWRKVEETVRGLQVRIAKAVKDGDWRKVKALQRFLTRSFSGRAMAVRRVTENQGRRTPGIDGELWQTPIGKYGAIDRLHRRGYQPKPLRRVHIPKANGKMRPLGIPTMLDRAMQALYLLALIPVAETQGDANSYGFRPMRATADAAEHCFKVLNGHANCARWVLEADIEGCFDNIDHDWLLAHVPMDKSMLRKWLKSGVVDMGKFRPIEAGTPQGGIISPTLANFALDGLEHRLVAAFGQKGTRKGNRNKVNLVRYADDFIVTGTSKELLENEVLPLVRDFLAERGLRLSLEKTRITHVDRGFDFLGWNVRRYGGKILIKPSRKNVKAFLTKIREAIKEHKAVAQLYLLWQLNPVIRGWANYHRGMVASEIFHKVDRVIWHLLYRWAKRRHADKGARWVLERYFHPIGGLSWHFAARTVSADERKVMVPLVRAGDFKIKRHVKIISEANPFDPEWDDYFHKRRQQKLLLTHGHKRDFAALLRKQNGLCAHCQSPITTETGWHVHHVKRRIDGGSDGLGNKVLLHKVCHIQHHHPPSVALPVPKGTS